jgi:hypothetical protein
MVAKCRYGSSTAATVAGARGSYDFDNGHEGGRLGWLLRDAAFLCGEHCQTAKRAAADIEGHSTAAKFSQPGRLRATVDVRASEMKEAAH